MHQLINFIDKKQSSTGSTLKSKMQAYHKSALQSLNSQMKKLYKNKINKFFGNPSTKPQNKPTDKKSSATHPMMKFDAQAYHKSALEGLKKEMKRLYVGKINF